MRSGFNLSRIGLAGLAVSLALALVGAAGAGPVVQTDAGAVSGVEQGGLHVFKGVPFAQPPVGDLRWRPAQPVKAWSGVKDATQYGPACLQKTKLTAAERESVGAVPDKTSEDCLTLNVWTPAKADHPLPVMVWLHGGGHTAGAGSLQFYDGTGFARDGVILVTLNYRLGFLGYFAHPALTREAASDALLGNYGTSDQLEALRWVQRNIAAFGGDPKNVTLFGESAGGMSTLAILATPSAKGLFAKAIVESGLGWAPARPLNKAEAEGAAIATKAGLPGADATPAQLRKIDAEALIAAADDVNPGLIVDGRNLPRQPALAFARGETLHAPLIIGTNSNEGSLIARRPAESVLAEASPSILAAVRAYYGAAVADDKDLARILWRDATFTAPARWVAAKASATQPVWLYHDDYVITFQRAGAKGVNHGLEIPFVFDSWHRIPLAALVLKDNDRAETSTIHGCWVSFARTGAPACPGAPAWPQYDPSTDQLMEFAPENTVKANFHKPMLDAIEAAEKAGGKLKALP